MAHRATWGTSVGELLEERLEPLYRVHMTRVLEVRRLLLAWRDSRWKHLVAMGAESLAEGLVEDLAGGESSR